MAPPTTNSPTIMMTTELEKPDSASSGVRIWNMSRLTSAQSATRSARILPMTKQMAVSTRMISVMYMVMNLSCGLDMKVLVWGRIDGKLWLCRSRQLGDSRQLYKGTKIFGNIA